MAKYTEGWLCRDHCTKIPGDTSDIKFFPSTGPVFDDWDESWWGDVKTWTAEEFVSIYGYLPDLKSKEEVRIEL